MADRHWPLYLAAALGCGAGLAPRGDGQPQYLIAVHAPLASMGSRERWRVMERARRIAARFGALPLIGEPVSDG